VPAPTAAGTGLRAAGRLLLSAQVAQPSETKQLLALMAQLSALTDTVTRLREAQDRAGQARAARQAAQALRAVTARYAGPGVPLVGAAAPVPASSGWVPGLLSWPGRTGRDRTTRARRRRAQEVIAGSPGHHQCDGRRDCNLATPLTDSSNALTERSVSSALHASFP